MTEEEIRYRIERVNAAFNERSALSPEGIEPGLRSDERGTSFFQDFRGGRSATQLDSDAAHILNEIMGIRDRAKKWFASKGDDPRAVDAFVKSELAVALVHDLANTDKHGQLDRPPFSGYRPKLVKVDRTMTLKYDPSTGTYAASGQYTGPTFNFRAGQVRGQGTSFGMEVVLSSDIHDESGNKIGELQRVLPDAIYKWELFLTSNGLALQ